MVLKRAGKVIAERQQSYGDPASSMARVAARWSTTLGVPITAEQVVLCLIDLKLTRLCHDPRHYDSAVDLAGYSALLQEVGR
jgi:Domain of unknown function (DUF6378)